MLWALQCRYMASSCMSLTHACKPDLLPEIFDLPIIWHCQPLVCQECCQWCFRMIGGGGRWRGAIAAQRNTAFYHSVQHSSDQRSVLLVSTAFYWSAQRSIGQHSVLLHLFNLKGQTTKMCRFNIAGFLHPNLVFGGVRNLVPPQRLPSGHMWYPVLPPEGNTLFLELDVATFEKLLTLNVSLRLVVSMQDRISVHYKVRGGWRTAALQGLLAGRQSTQRGTHCPVALCTTQEWVVQWLSARMQVCVAWRGPAVSMM